MLERRKIHVGLDVHKDSITWRRPSQIERPGAW